MNGWYEHDARYFDSLDADQATESYIENMLPAAWNNEEYLQEVYDYCTLNNLDLSFDWEEAEATGDFFGEFRKWLNKEENWPVLREVTRKVMEPLILRDRYK
jgi:hypothetical protein|nr:MAG TPA: hypothetical protein [Caudoviricetes sp.]